MDLSIDDEMALELAGQPGGHLRDVDTWAPAREPARSVCPACGHLEHGYRTGLCPRCNEDLSDYLFSFGLSTLDDEAWTLIDRWRDRNHRYA